MRNAGAALRDIQVPFGIHSKADGWEDLSAGGRAAIARVTHGSSARYRADVPHGVYLPHAAHQRIGDIEVPRAVHRYTGWRMESRAGGWTSIAGGAWQSGAARHRTDDSRGSHL